MRRTETMSHYMDIRTLRQESGLRLRDLAELANVSQSELSKCERGLVLPDEAFFVSIAGILSVDAAGLRDTHAHLLRTATPGEGYTTAKASRSLVTRRRAEHDKSAIHV